MDMITYPCWDWSEAILVEGATGPVYPTFLQNFCEATDNEFNTIFMT